MLTVQIQLNVMVVTFITIIVLSTIFITLKLLKANKVKSNFEEFTSTILDVTVDSMKLLSKDGICKYQSKEEFVNDLASMVTEYTIHVLGECNISVDKDKLLQFIKLVYEKSDKQLKITETYDNAKEEQKNNEAKIEEEIKLDTVNISEQISDISTETKLDNDIVSTEFLNPSKIEKELQETANNIEEPVKNVFTGGFGNGGSVEDTVQKAVTNISSGIDNFYIEDK